MHRFETQLKKGLIHMGWTYLDIPAAVSKKINRKGRVPVCGFIDKEFFNISMLPKGDGTHYLFVKQPLLKKIGKSAGDLVMLKVEEDLKPRVVEVPDEIIKALSVSPKALETFTRFSYSHKSELMDWINDAKKAETRERRII